MNDLSKRTGKGFPVLLPFVMAAVILLICFIAMNSKGPVNARTKGDPADTARRFLDAVVENNFAEADSLLYNCDGLHMPAEAETAAQAAIYAALAESYAYDISGVCAKSGVNAALPVNFRYLNIAGMGEDINAAGAQLHSQDKEANFEKAVNEVLEHAQDYYRNASFELKLIYAEDEWKVVADDALVAALSGKAGVRS